MPQYFANSTMNRQTLLPATPIEPLEIMITDMGCNDGIDVIIHGVESGLIVFETVLADANSRALLTNGTPETETFWQCVNRNAWAGVDQQLFLTARCRFNPLTIAVSTKRMRNAEMCNVRFLRLVEDLLDELQTREPGLAVQLAVTHRNPTFDRCINY